ncbi:hypothetical protein NQ315_006056 [Exocentrus adspersus]|uniref:PiggyBac transposable element-derived protein domain-containing protein n=1 Tax=Exocentrus adspersus TaxID=1586481 RepID=A0AAV8VFY3_9CUCU|nr:hypothetical protein NQ315_006056 [Exocentrus adspersus]
MLALADSESKEEPFESWGSDWSGTEEQEGNLVEDFEPVESNSEDGEQQSEIPVVNWVGNPCNMKNIQFSGQPGLKVHIPGEVRPIDFFLLLTDDNFFYLLVRETNAYAEEVLITDPNPRPQLRITHWKPIDKQEMKLPRLRDYWRKDRLYNYHLVVLSRNRFLLIMSCLHFSPNPKEREPRSTDKLYKVRLVDFFNNKMLATYSPQKNLSIDESMLLWRGRLMFCQYIIKNKKHKYGIKFYLLTESTGTIMKLQGQLTIGKGHAANIVLHLAGNYLDQGYSLYMDNFYNSVDLAKQLVDRNTCCTGTLRNGRKGNPSDVAKAKLKVGSGQICVGKWKDKRDVLYISIEHENID